MSFLILKTVYFIYFRFVVLKSLLFGNFIKIALFANRANGRKFSIEKFQWIVYIIPQILQSYRRHKRFFIRCKSHSFAPPAMLHKF